jgi:hypothetical protein
LVGVGVAPQFTVRNVGRVSVDGCDRQFADLTPSHCSFGGEAVWWIPAHASAALGPTGPDFLWHLMRPEVPENITLQQ